MKGHPLAKIKMYWKVALQMKQSRYRDFPEITVTESAVLGHEIPTGKFGHSRSLRASLTKVPSVSASKKKM